MSEDNRARAEGIVVVVMTLVLVRVFWLLSFRTGRLFEPLLVESAAKILLWCCGSVPVVLWLSRRHDTGVLEVMGLGPGAGRAVGFAILSTLPMIAALFLLPTKPFNIEALLGGGVLGPLAEELLFRGALFGVLWRIAGWSVRSSILVSSLLFGLAHYPHADSEILNLLRGPVVGHFYFGFNGNEVTYVRASELYWLDEVRFQFSKLVTSVAPLVAGGVVLAWITYRWNSLWPAIFLHACMNIWWDLTRGEHALPSMAIGPMAIAQMLSVAVAIGITLKLTTRTPGRLQSCALEVS